MRNLHLYYYKEYFSSQEVNGKRIQFNNLSLEEEKKRLPNSEKEKKEELSKTISKIEKENSLVVKSRNAVLCSTEYGNFNNPINRIVNVRDNHFELKISYPGLVTGVGINHEAKIEGEFKLGVHFDYTYGMPVVYGSSVKGVLRSSFILREEHGRILEYEPYFLKQITGRDWSQGELKLLFESIFEGKECGKPKSIYNRDIFFDAVITKADKEGRILCSDSITPHTAGPLKNPNPITFLKIASGCTMEFRFKLVNTIIKDELIFTADQKKALFEEIIKTVGVGAKTNVGYGQFE